jgi:hypothetical protein
MPSNKIEEVITIAKMGEKENKFWIKDQNGEFYSGFKEYEGTPNTEYAQLTMGNHNEPFKEGDAAMVVFTKTVGKDDKIYKNLKAIYPAGDRQPNQTPAQAEKPRSEANRGQSGASTDDFWEKKAYKQCLWGYWLDKVAPVPVMAGKFELREMDLVWETFKAIEKDADKRFSVSDESKMRTEPTIHADEDKDVEGIPF